MINFKGDALILVSCRPLIGITGLHHKGTGSLVDLHDLIQVFVSGFSDVHTFPSFLFLQYSIPLGFTQDASYLAFLFPLCYNFFNQKKEGFFHGCFYQKLYL